MSGSEENIDCSNYHIRGRWADESWIFVLLDGGIYIYIYIYMAAYPNPSLSRLYRRGRPDHHEGPLIDQARPHTRGGPIPINL
jgi:hypothetical protein